MKKLALPIAVCAVLTVIAMYLKGPLGSYAAIYGHIDSMRVALLWISMVVALIVAVSAMKTEQAWQGYTVLGVFALAAFKVRVWRLLGELSGLAFPSKLLALAITGGLICALLAVITAAGTAKRATS